MKSNLREKKKIKREKYGRREGGEVGERIGERETKRERDIAMDVEGGREESGKEKRGERSERKKWTWEGERGRKEQRQR